MAGSKMFHSITVLVCLGSAILVTAAPAAPSALISRRGYGYNDGYAVSETESEEVNNPAGEGAGINNFLTTSDFGPFFDDGASTVLELAAGADNHNILTTSDFGPFFEDGASTILGDLAGADQVFTQTGVGAKLVASFTVTDLATLVTPQPTSPGAPTSVPAAAAFSVSKAEESLQDRTTGVNARVVASTVVGADAVPSATSTPTLSAELVTSSGPTASPSEVVVQGIPPASIANQQSGSVISSLTFSATTTGINAIQRGFVTTTLSNASLTSSTSATPSASVSVDGSQAMKEQPEGVEIPGQKLSVLPIGLGVLGGLILLALIVVGYVTYERRKYRTQFRERKAVENAQNVAKMRKSIMQHRM